MKNSRILLLLASFIISLSSFAPVAHFKNAESNINNAAFTDIDLGYFIYTSTGQEYHAYGDASGNITHLWESSSGTNVTEVTLGVSHFWNYSYQNQLTLHVNWTGHSSGAYIGNTYY